MHIHEILCLDVPAGKFTKVYLVETMCNFSIGPKNWKGTHTTLLGLDRRNNRTAAAMMMMATSSFHSPDVKFSPPGAWLLPLLGTNPFDAASLRASASKWSC